MNVFPDFLKAFFVCIASLIWLIISGLLIVFSIIWFFFGIGPF